MGWFLFQCPEFVSKGWCILKNWRMLFFTPNVMASLVSSLWAEYLNHFGGVCPFCVLAWHNLLVYQQQNQNSGERYTNVDHKRCIGFEPRQGPFATLVSLPCCSYDNAQVERLSGHCQMTAIFARPFVGLLTPRRFLGSAPANPPAPSSLS